MTQSTDQADHPPASNNDTLQPQTIIAQGLGSIDPQTRAIILPIHIATTYERGPDNGYPGNSVYSRADNPTYLPAEALICQLEGGQQALLFASGMAAAVAVFQALKPGDHVLAPQEMYWALKDWLKTVATEWQLDVELIDMTQVATVRASIRPGKTRLVWLETPANPLWSVSDIGQIGQLSRQAGAILAVDSTVATPILTQPLALGADIVMHSATKYLNGHSDVISGVLICSQRLYYYGNNDQGTNRPHSDWQKTFWSRVVKNRAQGGAVPSPFDCSQLLRGMRTLQLRVKESCQSAMMIALALQQHPGVAEVLYPGLVDFVGHEVAAKQMVGGFGGMLSIRVKGGESAAIAVAAHVKVFKRATSLGGVESLIEHRASVEGPNSTVPLDLLRLSIGIEDKQDLLTDLVNALNSLTLG